VIERISVIVPTLNRDSLRATLKSCSGADQVVIMPDQDGTAGCYGHSLRNRALDEGLVKGDWIVSTDDDDEFLPAAFDKIRQTIRQHPNGPWFLFKMTFGEGSHCPGVTVWQGKSIKAGNVGTPMIVAPASAKARWGVDALPDLGGVKRKGWLGDLVYAQCLRLEFGEPVYVDETIAVIRPQVQSEGQPEPTLASNGITRPG
jgi:glycosyltransferase involved in cell wall biosynthesis